MLSDLVSSLTNFVFQPARDEKLCGRCEKMKAHSEFAASNRHEGGLKLQRWCKQCHREVNRTWYQQQRLEREVWSES